MLDTEKCAFLDMIDIWELNMIAGPYNVNNNHWIAAIIDCIRAKFIRLDPLNKPPPILDKCFKSWCTNYNSRKHKDDITWTIWKIDHPLQMDNFNCGVFVILFIKHYMNHLVCQDTIEFDTSFTFLTQERHLISFMIENYKKNFILFLISLFFSF